MIVDLTLVGNTVRLLGLLARADQGADPSRIAFYGTTKPAVGAAPEGTPLLEVVLMRPSCGSVVAGELVLLQQDTGGDLAMADGDAKWGRWFAGDGVALLDGDVTSNTGNGFFKIAGTGGVALRAGGRVRLGETRIT